MKRINKLLLLTVVSCSLASCGETKEEHTHAANNSSVTWQWNESLSSATATVKCADCGETLATVNATVTSRINPSPTCTENGKKTYTATAIYEGLTFTDAKEDVVFASGHVIGEEIVAEIPATCETAGMKAHYECQVCGDCFFKEGEDYVPATDLVIPAKGHQYGDLVAKVDARCGHDGMKAHYQCSVCEKYFDSDKKATTLAELTITAEEHVFGDYISVDDTTHKRVCVKCGDEVVENHDYEYVQTEGALKHSATCKDCAHALAEKDCVISWHDNDYSCECGREGEIQIPEKINLDLVLDNEVLSMGPNATPFVVTGAGEGSEVTNVSVAGNTVWDAKNKKFDEAIFTYWDVVTLDVEISNGDNTHVFEGLTTQIVSKSISTEAELKSMAQIANAISGKAKRYTGYFELAADITLTKVEPQNDAEPYTWGREHCMDCIDGSTCHATESLNGFSGIFDGNGHTIYNLNTTRKYDNRAHAAPFIMVLNEWGVMRNVAFHACEISSYSKFSLVGYGNGTVENVYVAPTRLGPKENTASSQHLEVFFAGNSNEAFGSPTLKNVVVEFNGADDSEFDYENSAIQFAPKSGYVFTSDYHARLPITEDVVVLTNKEIIKNHLVRMYVANAHSTLGGADAQRAKYDSIRNGADDFFISADKVDLVPMDIVTKETRVEVYKEKGAEWAEEWNSIWAEGSKVAMFEDGPSVAATLQVEKGKTEFAAIDNIAKVTGYPAGTKKIQYSKDGGSNWVDVVDYVVDYTVFSKVTELQFKALDATDAQIGEIAKLAIDSTIYAGGDTYVNANNTTGIAVSTSGITNSKPVVSSYWKADSEGADMPSKPIMYKCPSTTKTANSFHAATKITLAGAAKSDVDTIIPGSTARMYVNNDATGYKTGTQPYGIKKVAVWVFFSNFNVKLDDQSTVEVECVYNNGFFMTPVSGAGAAVTGYHASAKPFEVVQNGYAEKTWFQIVEDVTDWTASTGCGNTTGYFSFTNSVTLGTLTGQAGDMATSLLGATYQGHTVVDYSFTIGMNALQFVM